MTEIFQFLGWAFGGKAGNFPMFLLQWWIRVTALWIVLLILAVACAVVAAVLHPQADSILMAYVTLESSAALAILGPAILAAVLFAIYCVTYTLIVAALFFTTLLGV